MSSPRPHLAQPLVAGARIAIEGDRAHYLRTVLRLREGAEVQLFNAVAGEWRARLAQVGRHRVEIVVAEQLRPPRALAGPALILAPIRRQRLEWLLERAVELGLRALVPILTRRTVVRPADAGRLRTIAVEAAEQCGRLDVPTIAEPISLEQWLATRAVGSTVLYADEHDRRAPLLSALQREPGADLLIGPEGGFAPEEREALLAQDDIRSVGLGPLTLRTETAALAALAAWRLAHDRRQLGGA